METAPLLREARRAAGLTQSELARHALTVQPAIAAYESGAKHPNLSTLERLLDACGYDLDVAIRPRMRRGASTLRQLAETITNDIKEDRERDAVRLLFGFADDFRGSSRPGRIALSAEEPHSTGDARFDAALAGLAEFFAIEGGIPTPAWVNDPSRFVTPWWIVASNPSFEAYTIAHTPAVFLRHGVFMAREVFDRA